MTRLFVAIGLAILGAIAQADIIGKVKVIDQSGVTLDIGSKHPWGSTIAAQRRGEMVRQFPSGSLVRLRLDSGKIVSVRATSIQPEQIKTTNLQALKPYSSGFTFEDGHQFWGYLPQHTGVGRDNQRTIFKLDGKYDFLQFGFSFGPIDGSGKLFYRLGDGDPVSIVIPNTSLSRVVIDVRGANSIQIWCEAQRRDLGGGFESYNYFVDPVLLQLPSSVPVLSSPATKESVQSDEELWWRPVRDAVGYRVELECIRLYNTDDALKQRFFTVQTNAETRVVKLSDVKLPLGEYRWRVHSLDDVGVMGQMNEWWSFTLTK